MWVSGMEWFLLEGFEAGEDGVDVACVGGEVEGRFEIDPRCALVVAATELAEVELFLPGAHRRALDEAIGVVAGEPGLDERVQDTLAEEEEVAFLPVAGDPLGAPPPGFRGPGGTGGAGRQAG